MDYKQLAREFLKASHNFKIKNDQKKYDKNMEGEMFVIFYILNTDYEVTPGLIRESLNVSSARVAAILNSLEKKELIVRNVDENDKRRVLVTLTKAGVKKAEDTKSNVLNHISSMLEFLGEEDAKNFVKIMKKLSTRCRKEEN